MQPSFNSGRPSITSTSWTDLDRQGNAQTEPLTPAVTGINYPSPIDVPSDNGRHRPFVVTGGSGSSSGSIEPITPIDINTIDQLWSSIRLAKERKMEKDPPKVNLFGGGTDNPDQPRSSYRAPEPRRVVHKAKSLYNKASFSQKILSDSDPFFQGNFPRIYRWTNARFDIPGIKKQDVHVSFQGTRLVITWQTVTVTDREEEGRIIRERREKVYSQTIPLPEGTRFEQVRAAMDGRHLLLKYPNVHSGGSSSRSRENLQV